MLVFLLLLVLSTMSCSVCSWLCPGPDEVSARFFLLMLLPGTAAAERIELSFQPVPAEAAGHTPIPQYDTYSVLTYRTM